MLILYAIPLAYLLYAVITAAKKYGKTQAPGPWYTYISSLPLKYHELSKNRRLWIHSLHQKYGSVVRLAPNEVAFASQDALKEIYQIGGSGYDKTEFYMLFYQYDERTMFSTLNKQDHAQRKKLFAERYAMTNIMRPDVLGGIQQRAKQVADICAASIGHHLDVYVTLHCYALDGASHFLFNPGGTDSLGDPEDFKIMQELSYHDSIKQRYLDYYMPMLTKFPKPFQSKVTSLATDYCLRQARSGTAAESSLIAKLTSKSSPLSTVQSAAECMDHLAAGIDTTGDGLCFLMHELSLPRSQHVQARLCEELRAKPSATLEQLPYLDAVIKEGLRLFPPIPMSFPRYVPGPEGRNISGYDIPAGTSVSCQPYSMHLLDPVFNGDDGRSADCFAPERWLNFERSVEMNRSFFAFGAGGRGCIGRNLAMVEMKCLLREVYIRFSTVIAPEMKGNMSIDDQVIASRPKDQTCLLEFRQV